MKRFIAVLLLLLAAFSATAYAEDTQDASAGDIPQLVSISFKNATINGTFISSQNEYTIKLDDPEISPTLEDYKIEGKANLFINYILDEAHRQKGICATLEFESGSTIYNFYYENAYVKSNSSNNTLVELTGTAVEVYPKMTEKNSRYTLYIPSDMTKLSLAAVTEDVSAYCNIPAEIEIAVDQEPEIPVTVTAANGETRIYRFTVKRVDKTTDEVLQLMQSDGFKTLAKDELFYRKPLFYIIVFSVLAGASMLMLIVSAAKRISVKTDDEDEEPFFTD